MRTKTRHRWNRGSFGSVSEHWCSEEGQSWILLGRRSGSDWWAAYWQWHEGHSGTCWNPRGKTLAECEHQGPAGQPDMRVDGVPRSITSLWHFSTVPSRHTLPPAPPEKRSYFPTWLKASPPLMLSLVPLNSPFYRKIEVEEVNK